jgi:hypothetical protein
MTTSEGGTGRNDRARDPSPTCYLHVPKSGGSSILAALEAALPPGSLAPRRFDSTTFCDFEDVELLQPTLRTAMAANPHEVLSLARYRAVSGHFSLPTLLQVTGASSICTVLREPRARILSLYMYWRTPGIGDAWEPYRAHEHARRPLPEFLTEPLLAPVLDNQVCRMLLHGDPRLPPTSFAAQSDIEAIAADAIALIDTLGFVGILELGESAWHGVARMFAVPLDPLAVNVTGEHVIPAATRLEEQLPVADALRALEERCAADTLVYEHALAHAGVGAEERRRIADGAFAHELVKLGDLLGHSAARAAGQAEAIAALRGQLEEHEQTSAELDDAHARVALHQQALQDLQNEVQGRDAEIERLRRWLGAVHSSASWRITAPLRAIKHALVRTWPTRTRAAKPAREPSLLAGLSVAQVWWFALALTSLIAASDALLTHVVLIALLTIGPFCGLLTGRWTRTATVGIWALALAIPLAVPDKIWDTTTQLVDTTTVATAALLATSAASLIERRG